jgi:predicted O-linked N-acetylglucosamine transferase (SPINDLY family)
MTPEFRLLLACARLATSEGDEAAIRRLIAGGIDWTGFVRGAVDHGLTGLVGQTLARVAPEMVPEDMLDAFRLNIQQAGARNSVLLDELMRTTETLAKGGVETIPFRGPNLALEAYGDFGLRLFSDLDLFIHPSDMAQALAVLREAGYANKTQFKTAQIALIQRLEGRANLFNKPFGIGLRLFTRLTSINLALDIDYPGLWQRARSVSLDSRTRWGLSPEDQLIVLSIPSESEFWLSLEHVCDVAAFISSHPKLDWSATTERARRQGCLVAVLLATALAHRFFDVRVSDAIRMELAHPRIERRVARILGYWLAAKATRQPGDGRLRLDGLLLHDGLVQRGRYVAGTFFLPAHHHVTRIPLPSRFTSLLTYVPLKIIQDLVLLPPLWAYRHTVAHGKHLRDRLASHEFAAPFLPASNELRLRWGEHRRACAQAKEALAVDPKNSTAWHNLANALFGLNRYSEAITCYEKAVALAPDNAGYWRDRAAAIRADKQQSSLMGIEDEPTPDSQDADAWARRAGYLFASKRFSEASEASNRALAIRPKHLAAMRIGIRSRISACDWRSRETDKRRITEGLQAGLTIITPFNHRVISDSESENLAVAQLWTKGMALPTPLWRGERYGHDRIRIAYLSAEFHEHPMTIVMAGVYEHHDRTRFESIAISLSANDGSEMRRRIVPAFDRFIDAQAMNDAEIAALIRALEADIVIDLNGYAGAKRTGILAYRPAPVQVNFLAYCGTTALPFMDYIIADRTLIPEENRVYYSEQVAYLPHTYMPTDATRPIAERTPSRIEAGLPEQAFVFACHNGEQKLSPEIFSIWMRLLKTVDGSVLWLKTPDPSAMGNLRREAKSRGVAPERLVFAPRVPKSQDHLARLRLADLFLDTLPYNAHATACDALWAGLPVLTCLGTTFAGRVGASLLYAAGLPELVTASLAEYEDLALTLARNPQRLAALKEKLMRNCKIEPLFDTARFTRDLEAVYRTMWQQQQAGLPPDSFAVARTA